MEIGWVFLANIEKPWALFLPPQFGALFWFLGVLSGKCMVLAVLWEVRPKGIEVRTNGLIFGAFFLIPWEHFRGFGWNSYSQDLMLLSEGNFSEWKILKSERETLERALIEFIPKSEGFSEPVKNSD